MLDEGPESPGESQGWDVGESLRHSLGAFPLRLDVLPGRALAELRPQIEDELRTVARLERRRHLSAREHRQAKALRDLLTVIKDEGPDHRRRP